MKRTPVVTIRTVQPDDAAAIRSFICRLSPRSLYLRFFASAAPPSSALLRTLTGATGADILVVTDEAGVVVGHGMAAPEPAASDGQPGPVPVRLRLPPARPRYPIGVPSVHDRTAA